MKILIAILVINCQLLAQTTVVNLGDGQAAQVNCSAQVLSVSQTGTSATATCSNPPPPPSPTGFVIDHASIALFDQIPEQYLTAAQSIRMMWVDRSVGTNVNDGLNCLTYANTALAPNSCKRTTHVDPAFSSSSSDVSWSRTGGYPRPNWTLWSWPGLGLPNPLPCTNNNGIWTTFGACFEQSLTLNGNAILNSTDVLSFQFSYLEADVASINDATNGFFHSGSNWDVGNATALEVAYPAKKFIYWTTSLARGSTAVLQTFNADMRTWAVANGKVLFDFSDIEQHAPLGSSTPSAPCFDNRDGVLYSNGNGSENYVDDGLATPSICQHYTREIDGGHLGNPDVGKIYVAKAFWVLMARLAGWVP